MAKKEVLVLVEQDLIYDDKNQLRDGIVVVCPICERRVECIGTSTRSVGRGCAVLRDECTDQPDKNWYTTDELKAEQEAKRRGQGKK